MELRKALEESYDDVVEEKVQDTVEAAETTAAAESPPPVESPTTATDASTPPVSQDEATAPPTEIKPATELGAGTKHDKAPGSWKPSAREKWASVDPMVREEVYRRESEISRGLNQTNKEAQFGREVNEVVSPFAHTFRAVGVDPKQAISKLLETDSILRYGTPVDKAQRVHELLAYYGVDFGALASIVNGQQPEQQPVDPIVAQLNQRIAFLERGNQAAQQKTEQDLKGELDGFAGDPANEFYKDVRLDMATLLESGAAKDLKDAYDKATWANPETRKVLLERQAVELARSTSRRAAAAREASSSLGPTGAPVSSQVDPSNLRALIAAQMESAGDRL